MEPSVAGGRQLASMNSGEEADLFLLMTLKEELTTRDGNPYFRVGFRDTSMEITFPVWGDSQWAERCREEWLPGQFYKLRAVYRETNFGPQLELHRIRPVEDRDREEGFDPNMCLPRSRFDRPEMFEQLVAIACEQIQDEQLSTFVVHMLEKHRDQILDWPSATRNHHAFVGGLLEHVLSVTRTCVFLAEKYAHYYSDLDPPLNQDLVLSGAILHDIGKLRELEHRPQGPAYTPAGQLIGHVLQGRDMIRELAGQCPLPPETQLRLEHIVVSHQRLAEWGAPKPPMTPEALIVHYADDLDAKFQMMAEILRNVPSAGPMTTSRNPLKQSLFRGEASAAVPPRKPK